MNLRAWHEALPISHLRLVQVLATAWLFTGQSLVMPGAIAFTLLSTALCLALLVTPFTRASALALGALIVLEVVLQPTWFAHNRLYVAALLLMVGLSSKRFGMLPRWQVALVYFVAALDKGLEPAWRDGRFFESFIAQLSRFGLMWAPGGTVGAPNPLATFLEHAGTRPMWMALGLGVIALELGLALCFVFRLRVGAWLNAAFHVGVFALTGSTMGQFFFAGAASSLLLVDEEKQPGPWLTVLTTVALAGPWTHRFLPAVFFLGYLLWQRRICGSLRR